MVEERSVSKVKQIESDTTLYLIIYYNMKIIMKAGLQQQRVDVTPT